MSDWTPTPSPFDGPTKVRSQNLEIDTFYSLGNQNEGNHDTVYHYYLTSFIFKMEIDMVFSQPHQGLNTINAVRVGQQIYF
jgi:hypothetical protein